MSFFGILARRVKAFFVPSGENAYRPRLLRRGALVALVALVLTAEAALVGTLAARQAGHPFLAAVVTSEVVALTNTERTEQHLSALTENAQLDAAAKAKATDMATKGYFAHVSPDGKEPWAWIDEAGYDYQYAGENLAVRFVDSKDVVEGWMASPTHRANIVKPVYADIGVATVAGIYKGEPATFVVQYFGTPSAAALAARAEVLGAQTLAPPPSFSDSLGRQLMRVLAEPRAATSWALGGVALFLMLALVFAFFHHIQLQAGDLLAPGTLVVAVALILVLFNTHFLAASVAADATASQGAAAASVGLQAGLEVGAEGATWAISK